MKPKFVGMVFLVLFAAVAMAMTVSYTSLRPAGSDTYPGNLFYMAVDSADSHKVDTFYSDTFDVWDGEFDITVADFLNMGAELTGFTVCDSCNDSVVIVVTAKTQFDNEPARSLWVDTFTTTLDSTEVLRKDLRTDSLVLAKIFFETIVKDSFVAGAAQSDNDDSLRLAINYYIAEKR